MVKFIVFPRGLETWPRVKVQQNSTSESGGRSGISADSLGVGNGFESCPPMEFTKKK